LAEDFSRITSNFTTPIIAEITLFPPAIWTTETMFLRLDLLVIQLAAMLLSFCGHYYIDSQYHVAGSWLGRFSWFNRKQQLHFIHHRHGKCNFAVIDFFWDRLLGTYRRANLEDAL
jgi:sterol desaturase/sphingolipid hydroxylase (fatty acid hydroxylase superfamily)